jgi:endonuclease/exonuclease/phosphatase family metal-dependent hydrolase
MRAIPACLLVLIALGGPTADAAAAPRAEPLRVMTYNLRYASDTAPHSWRERRPIMKACLREARPDVIGTQEGLYPQLQDLAADLSGYDWIGLGREGGSRGEFMAVFFRRERLLPLEYDHFWLSDTPDVIGSATWGNRVRRMVTWVRFRDRRSDREFFFVNTHFDHEVQEAREKSAALVRSRVLAWNTSLPILLVGDFNAAAGRNPAYAALAGDGFFTDAWLAAKRRENEDVSTFNGFRPLRREGERIDWILTRGPWRADHAATLTFSREGRYPSDHFPVLAVLRLED